MNTAAEKLSDSEDGTGETREAVFELKLEGKCGMAF